MRGLTNLIFFAIFSCSIWTISNQYFIKEETREVVYPNRNVGSGRGYANERGESKN